MKPLMTLSMMIVLTVAAGTYAEKRDVAAIGRRAVQNGRVSSTKPARDFTRIGPNARFMPGQLLVRFAPDTQGAAPAAAAQKSILAAVGGGTILRDYALVPGLSLVKLPADQNVSEAVLKNFNASAKILYAMPDYVEDVLQLTTPNDPYFSTQWGLYHSPTGLYDTNAKQAWDYETGSADIVVAVIDSGIDYDHPDLAANMWTNTAEVNGTANVDDDDNGYVDDIYGYDFCTSDGDSCDSDPMDDNGHGTLCAGIIGSVGNNQVGYAGVCWTVSLMALRFANTEGSGNISDEIAAIEYAVDNGAHILNLSNRTTDPNAEAPFEDAIDAAAEANVIVVTVAGNNLLALNIDNNPIWPACCDCDNIITVMASTIVGAKASGTNYGTTCVDLAAPGANIDGPLPGGLYGYGSGTSMAAPFVSGACALLLSMNPSLSYQDVKDILMDTVETNGYLDGLCVSEGILNLYGAVTDDRVE